jgi:hypothetical protein
MSSSISLFAIKIFFQKIQEKTLETQLIDRSVMEVGDYTFVPAEFEGAVVVNS